MNRHLIGAACAFALVVASPSPAARAAAPGLAPGFDHVSIPVPAQRLDTDPARLGIPRTSNMMGCHNDNLLLASKPSATFTVKDKVSAVLTIHGDPNVDVRGYALMLPDQKIRCIAPKKSWASYNWDPGTYELYVVAYGKLTYHALEPVTLEDGKLHLELTDLTAKRAPLPLDGPNPVRFDHLRHDARTWKVDKLGVRCFDASSTTEDPALVLTVPKPVAKLRVWVGDNTPAIVVTDASGKSACTQDGKRGRRFVDLTDVPAGELLVRQAASDGGRSYDDQSRGLHLWTGNPFAHPEFSVALEDLSRPRDLPWAAGDEPLTVRLAGPLDAALTHVVKAAGARGEALPDVDSARLKVTAGQTDRVGGSCRGFTHAARPDVLLDVARPMTDVWYRATTNPALRVVLEGPFGDDGREVEAEYTWRCLAGGDQPRAAFPRLEMGRYRVYFAFPDKAESDDVAFVLGTEKSPERPLERLREPAASLAVTDKRLLPYYPMLPMDSNAWLRLEDLHPDERQALFLDAPRSLFAYPKFDLDKATAQLSGIDPRKLEELGVEIAWPKTDEPLLVVRQDRDRVVALTADATVVVVEAKYLVAAPAGAPVVPTEMRNRILTWDDVVRWAADEDRKEIDAVDKANDKAEACYSDYWDAHHGGVSGRLSLITYVNGRVASVRDYTAMVKDAAGKKCGLAAVEKKKEKAFGKLDARFRKRGAEALTQIAARFAAP